MTDFAILSKSHSRYNSMSWFLGNFESMTFFDSTGTQCPSLALDQNIREKDIDVKAELLITTPASNSRGVRLIVR